MTDTSKVTRLEIIDYTLPDKGPARVYVKWDIHDRDKLLSLDLQLQDQGGTLKIFITPTREKESHD